MGRLNFGGETSWKAKTLKIKYIMRDNIKVGLKGVHCGSESYPLVSVVLNLWFLLPESDVYFECIFL